MGQVMNRMPTRATEKVHVHHTYVFTYRSTSMYRSLSTYINISIYLSIYLSIHIHLYIYIYMFIYVYISTGKRTWWARSWAACPPAPPRRSTCTAHMFSLIYPSPSMCLSIHLNTSIYLSRSLSKQGSTYGRGREPAGPSYEPRDPLHRLGGPCAPHTCIYLSIHIYVSIYLYI